MEHMKKLVVQAACSLDVLDLQRERLFSKGSGYCWTRSWKRGAKVMATVRCRLEGEAEVSAVRLSYVILDSTGSRRPYDYRVPIIHTHCTFGGTRPWFQCPRCEVRRRILYLPPTDDIFACRECHRLTYRCRQLHRNRLYEGVTRPLEVLDQLEDRIAAARTEEDFHRVVRGATVAREVLQESLARLREGGIRSVRSGSVGGVD